MATVAGDEADLEPGTQAKYEEPNYWSQHHCLPALG